MSVNEAIDYEKAGVISSADSPMNNETTLTGSNRRWWPAHNLSSTAYGMPYYCGRVGDMLLGYMYGAGRNVELRFAFNATGGGIGCPAWGYEVLIPEP